MCVHCYIPYSRKYWRIGGFLVTPPILNPPILRQCPEKAWRSYHNRQIYNCNFLPFSSNPPNIIPANISGYMVCHHSLSRLYNSFGRAADLQPVHTIFQREKEGWTGNTHKPHYNTHNTVHPCMLQFHKIQLPLRLRKSRKSSPISSSGEAEKNHGNNSNYETYNYMSKIMIS